jgi:hypothetical protein
MHNECGTQAREEILHAGTIAHIQLMMREAGQGGFEAALIPPSIPSRPKEHRTLIVIHAVDRPPQLMKVGCDL